MPLVTKKLFNDLSKLGQNWSHSACKLLLMLIAIDLVFFAFHIGNGMGIIEGSMFKVTRDRGYAELYQYIKEIWICLLLVFIGLSSRKILFFAWTVPFALILVDDSMRVHERMGRFLASTFELPAVYGLRPFDLGEYIYAAVAGTLLLALVAFAHLKADNRDRLISWALMIAVAMIAFFGIVVDLAHVVFSGNAFWGLVEDGGEMLVVSAVLALLFHLDPSKEWIRNERRYVTVGRSKPRYETNRCET